MTVIAWDGVTLAADRQASFGEVPTGGALKIWRSVAPDGRAYLCGASGLGEHCRGFRAWLDGKGDKPTFNENFSAIVIDERRRIWYRNADTGYARVRLKVWALGAGCDYAIGAMAAGATAVQAIKIASKFDVWCGFGVSKLTF